MTGMAEIGWPVIAGTIVTTRPPAPRHRMYSRRRNMRRSCARSASGGPARCTVFSISAPVGHSFTQAPHDTQLEEANPSCRYPALPQRAVWRIRPRPSSRRRRLGFHRRRAHTAHRKCNAVIEGEKWIGLVANGARAAPGGYRTFVRSDLLPARQDVSRFPAGCSDRYSSMIFAALDAVAPCRSGRSCRLAPAWYRQLKPVDLPLRRDTGDTIRMEPNGERRRGWES